MVGPLGRLSRLAARAALVIVWAYASPSGTAHALPEGPTIELGWRWALSPASDDGLRLLDSLELASLVPIAGSFALQPSVTYGVSYGTPWYALQGFGFEAVYSPAAMNAAGDAPDRRRVVPRFGGGLAAAFESVVREGAAATRASRRADLMLVGRLGVDFVRARRLFGVDLRLAIAPADELTIAGPIDVGLTFRGGLVVRRGGR